MKTFVKTLTWKRLTEPPVYSKWWCVHAGLLEGWRTTAEHRGWSVLDNEDEFYLSACRTEAVLIGPDAMPAEAADLISTGAGEEVDIINLQWFHTQRALRWVILHPGALRHHTTPHYWSGLLSQDRDGRSCRRLLAASWREETQQAFWNYTYNNNNNITSHRRGSHIGAFTLSSSFLLQEAAAINSEFKLYWNQCWDSLGRCHMTCIVVYIYIICSI